MKKLTAYALPLALSLIAGCLPASSGGGSTTQPLTPAQVATLEAEANLAAGTATTAALLAVSPAERTTVAATLDALATTLIPAVQGGAINIATLQAAANDLIAQSGVSDKQALQYLITSVISDVVTISAANGAPATGTVSAEPTALLVGALQGVEQASQPYLTASARAAKLTAKYPAK